MQDNEITSSGIPGNYAFRVKGLRSRLGLTQEGLAKRIGVSVLTINRWEKELTRPLPVAWARLLLLEGAGSQQSVSPSYASDPAQAVAGEPAGPMDVQAEMREFHRRFASSAWQMLRSFERRLGEIGDVATQLKQDMLARRMGTDAEVPDGPARSVALYIELDVLMPGVSRWHLYVMGWLRRFLGERGLAGRVYIGRREYRTIAEAGLPPELLEPTCTEFMDAVDRDRIAAVLAISTPPHPRWVGPLRRRGVPIVGTSAEYENRVGMDFVKGLVAALDYFQSLGRNRIAMIHWGGYSGARQQGELAVRFTQLLRQRGLPIHPQWVRGDLHPTTTGAGWEEFREVWSTGREKPDALIVADDCLLADVDTAMGEMKIQVPDQVTVVGFTNRHIVMPTRLLMARVEADPQAYAEAMGRMLLDMLADKPPKSRERMVPLRWIDPTEHRALQDHDTRRHQSGDSATTSVH